MTKRMRVLVACEESQAVTIEMRRLGHEAYSCDIQECSGGHPEWHIRADALEILKMEWDLVIAHPPCTYLTAAGAVRLYNADHSIKDPERFRKGEDAAWFFMAIWGGNHPRIAIENPVPMSVFGLPPPSQIVEPYMFGDPWRKRTCLWIRGLPPLIAMREAPVEPEGLWVGATSARRDPTIRQRYRLHSNRDQKRRSKTFPGIARAMAEQWAGQVDE